MAPANGRQVYVLYRISVLDYRSDYRTVTDRGYLGISDRVEGEYRTDGGKRVHGAAPYARFLEHSAKRPFGDIIVGQPEVVDTYDSREAAEAGELAAIARELPQYNVDGNPDHPDRVCPWDADTMRAERDAARADGRPLQELGHRRYVTTNRTRPDRVKPRRPDRAGSPQTNGYNHAADRPAVAAPAARPSPRKRAAPRKQTPPVRAQAVRPAGRVLFRRVAVALAVFVAAWLAGAEAAGAAGMELPAVIAAPTSALLASVIAIWLNPTT